MVIESGNVRFEHNAPEKKRKFTDKQIIGFTVPFSLFLCCIFVAVVMGATTFVEDAFDDNIFIQSIIVFVILVVLIVVIGISIVIFVKFIYGDTNQMNANTIVGYMTGADFELGFFKDELILKRTFADKSVSYNPLSEILNKMFWCMEDIEIDSDVDSTKPIRLDVNVDFSEKQVRAVISNV